VAGSLPYPSPTNTGEWAKDFLADLGDPLSASNVGYVEAWENVESPSGYGYNPLGTKELESGSSDANAAGVQAYRSWAQGLLASVTTLKADPANVTLEADLAQGDASLAQLSAAQAVPGASWATGDEPGISALGSSTPFHYGGAQGEQPGVAGIAAKTGDPTGLLGQYVTGPLKWLNNLTGGDTGATGLVNAAPDAVNAAAKSVLSPLFSWVEAGAADVTFIGFGLILIVVGLIVTFKDTSVGEGASTVAEAAAA
jgi:hypothetical protein